MRRHRNEDGAVGGVEGLAFGVVVFVFGALIVANAWGVIDAKMAASAAAREAARTYVEGTSQASAEEGARLAAEAAMSGHNRTISSIRIGAADASDAYGRCIPVVAVVETKVPRVPLPLIERRAGTYNVSASHREVIDPYKAGLAGAAACRP